MRYKFALWFALLCSFAACSAEKDERPNVLIYLIDTVRRDHVSTYGYAIETTPALDELAQDGVVFLHAYAQSSWTKPSVASIFTSKQPRSHGTNRWKATLKQEQVTLAETLLAANFDTAAFVSNELISAKFDFDQGFQKFQSVGSMSLRSSDHLVDAAKEWLSDRSTKHPFFLYVHSTEPHAPYIPPRKTLVGLGVSVVDHELGQLKSRRAARLDMHQNSEAWPGLRSDLIGLYDGEIALADANLGRLIQHLKDLGIYDSTLILVLSDHGEEFGDHGDMGHGDSLFIEQLAVPLVVKFPGSWRAGHRESLQVRHVDLMPTILDYVGLPATLEFHGESLLPLLRGEDTMPERPVAVAYLHCKKLIRQESIIAGRYHLIRDLQPPLGKSPIQLYNIWTDPTESRDLVELDPETVRRLIAMLDAHNQARDQVSKAPIVELSEEETNAIRALGYGE